MSKDIQAKKKAIFERDKAKIDVLDHISEKWICEENYLPCNAPHEFLSEKSNALFKGISDNWDNLWNSLVKINKGKDPNKINITDRVVLFIGFFELDNNKKKNSRQTINDVIHIAKSKCSPQSVPFINWNLHQYKG